MYRISRRYTASHSGMEYAEVNEEDIQYYLGIYRSEDRQRRYGYIASDDDEEAINSIEFWLILMEYETLIQDPNEYDEYDYEYEGDAEVEQF